LKDERDEENNTRERSIEWHICVLNETLIKNFKGFIRKEVIPSRNPRSSNVCQSCNMVCHGAFACSKFSNKPKCDKCGGGHIIEKCGLKCSYCLVWDTHKNVARRRIEKDLLPLQTIWRFWLMTKMLQWQNLTSYVE
jgi:hypothetical protein